MQNLEFSHRGLSYEVWAARSKLLLVKTPSKFVRFWRRQCLKCYQAQTSNLIPHTSKLLPKRISYLIQFSCSRRGTVGNYYPVFECC